MKWQDSVKLQLSKIGLFRQHTTDAVHNGACQLL